MSGLLFLTLPCPFSFFSGTGEERRERDAITANMMHASEFVGSWWVGAGPEMYVEERLNF